MTNYVAAAAAAAVVEVVVAVEAVADSAAARCSGPASGGLHFRHPGNTCR